MRKCPGCGSEDLQKIDEGAFLGRGAIVGCHGCCTLFEQVNAALGESKEWEPVGELSELARPTAA
jgi:ssDNA-binding Zn-finger/Zn-ribbon topoisomerase 1